MKYKLNPSLSVVRNKSTSRTYLVNQKGSDAVINDDAFRLLNNEIQNWHQDPDYSSFYQEALKENWIVEEDNSNLQAIIREVNQKYHLRRVQVEMLLQCNLTCGHCYCSSSPLAAKGLTTNDFKKLIDQLANMGVLILDMTGGEPLLRKDIFELIHYANEKGLAVSIFSNGTLITKEVAKKLKELSVFRVQISLDALTPEVHDKIRGKSGAFVKAIEGALNLKEENVSCAVNIMVNKLNVKEIRQLTDFISQKLSATYSLDRIIPTGRAIENSDIVLTNEEYFEALKNAYPDIKPVTSKVCDSAVKSSAILDPSCGVGASYCFIKHDGTVVLCPTMTTNESPDFTTAKFQDSSMDDIWNNHPTFNKYRGIQCENIKTCPSGNNCRGGCRSNAYLLHNSINSPDEMSCNMNKNPKNEYVHFLELYKKNIYTIEDTENV